MARELTQVIQDQITTRDIRSIFIFKINGEVFTTYLVSWNVSFDKDFGSSRCTFTLNNDEANFSSGGTDEILIGDTVELIEQYEDDTTVFRKFYGIVNQRSISKTSQKKEIQLSCLDYISVLKHWNVNQEITGTRIKVTNEVLDPVYLPSPQDSMAQLFNFANDALAANPLPFIQIREKHYDKKDDQYDGFQVYYDVGQVKLGSPLNVRDNYDLMATYYHYIEGVFIEDAIQQLLTDQDGYGNYLFGETSAQDVIDNHLTDTFFNVEGRLFDTMAGNQGSLEVTIESPLTVEYTPTVLAITTLTQDYICDQPDTYDATIMYLSDTSGYEITGSGVTEGTATIGDYTITYTGLGSGNTLTGVVVTPLERNFSAGTEITKDTEVTQGILFVEDLTGFPEPQSGEVIECEINGDIFTYSAFGSTPNTLEGIPTSGEYALSTKPNGSYVQYIQTYPAGQVWALTYTNVYTDLVDANFTYPSGYSGEMTYFDKRYGRIVLSAPVLNPESAIVTCDVDYSFSTLQATGIEINRIIFREREIDNRYDALNELRKYVAPNYIIRTVGDDKVWASYLTQKSVADYDLTLATQMDYGEDEDLYSRVKIWTKNENPTNIMFGDDIDYESEEESSYTGIASKEELMYIGVEKSDVLSSDAGAYIAEGELFPGTDYVVDVINYLKETFIDKDYTNQPQTGYRVYATPISDEHGRIILDQITPVVFLNGVPIDNQIHLVEQMPCKVKTTTKTITESGGKSKSVSVHTYYYYDIYFPHSSIEPTKEITLFDQNGVSVYTIAANDPNMDYGAGHFIVPGIEQNSIADSVSTASYYVLYDASKLEIDYENVAFKIDQSLIPQPDQVSVRATFEYWAIAVGVRDIRSVVDGRRDTQLQLEFFGEPLAGFHLVTLDLGDVYNIQAIDLVGGFFKPDNNRKFDVDFTISMQSSLNGVEFYAISEETEQFGVTGGEAVTFEEDTLGAGLEARYIKFNLYDVARIPYGRGRYVVALTEISIYNDIVLTGEAKLIATSILEQNASFGDTEVYLEDASQFTEPESGESATAYLGGEDSFTYTGIESGSVLTGCVIGTGIAHLAGSRVSQTISDDTNIYDDDSLLPQLGDRLKKKNFISDRNLYSQAETNAVAKAYLTEYYKDHSKLKVTVMYSPYLLVGQTISVTDPYNNKLNVNYFIESISDRTGGQTSLVLARYP